MRAAVPRQDDRATAVREAAVVPFDDANGLTRPRAYLVLREGFVESPALIEELCATVAPLGSYKVPGSFRVWDYPDGGRWPDHCVISIGIRRES